MVTVEQRLQQLAADCPVAADPVASLPRVVRRGRVRLAAVRAVAAVAAGTVALAAVATVPRLVEALRPDLEITSDTSHLPPPPPAPRRPAEVVVLDREPVPVRERARPGATVSPTAAATVRAAEPSPTPVQAAPAKTAPKAEPAPPPKPSPTDEPSSSPVVAWSANQKYAEKEHDPPYNYYFGTAAPGTVVHVGSQYGSAETVAGEKGAWEVKVWFEGAPEGSHTWTVVVESSAGDRSEFAFTGHRPGAQEVVFTANQRYGSSDATPPYDVFWGTAAPGSEVWIVSEYGEATTVADAAGNWEVRVEFPEAPVGVTFTVKAKSLLTGVRSAFEFTALPPAA